jgi:hypothetical protein
LSSVLSSPSAPECRVLKKYPNDKDQRENNADLNLQLAGPFPVFHFAFIFRPISIRGKSFSALHQVLSFRRRARQRPLPDLGKWATQLSLAVRPVLPCRRRLQGDTS